MCAATMHLELLTSTRHLLSNVVCASALRKSLGVNTARHRVYIFMIRKDVLPNPDFDLQTHIDSTLEVLEDVPHRTLCWSDPQEPVS